MRLVNIQFSFQLAINFRMILFFRVLQRLFQVLVQVGGISALGIVAHAGVIQGMLSGAFLAAIGKHVAFAAFQSDVVGGTVSALHSFSISICYEK